MAKKKIKRNKRYFNTYDGGGLLSQFASWNEEATKNFMSSDRGVALGKLGGLSGGLGGLANGVASTVSGFINPSGNNTGVGNAMQAIGSVASNIPGIGGVIGAGVNLIGGLVNAAFGSNLNKEFITQTEDKTKQQASYTSSAKDNASLLSDWASYTDMAHVKQDDVGSDGWFSNKAKNKTEELNKGIDKANFRAWSSLADTASNIDTNNDMLVMSNFSAYGGPITMRYTGLMSPFGNQFKDGGGIHIKPENRGKFTALKKRTGKSASWFKAHGTPAQKKMATFALNARKWKHDDGGPLLTHGGIWSNGITTIDNGGTHEENPFEGVQMGVDPQGIPNLVEEGEVVFNDYVFSNRMKVPKDVKKRLKIKSDTYADAAKELSKESEERPNDPISKNGLDFFMSALSESQEELRMKNEDKRNNRYAKGGQLGKLFKGPGPDPNMLIPDWLWYDNSSFSDDNRDDNHIFPAYTQSGLVFDTSDSNTATINWDESYSPNSEFSKLRNFYIDNWDNPNFRKYRDAYIQDLSETNDNMDLSKFTLDDFKRITSDRKLGQGHILTSSSNNVKALLDTLNSINSSRPSLTSLFSNTREIPTISIKDLKTVDNGDVETVSSRRVRNKGRRSSSYLRYTPAIMSGVSTISDIFSEPDYSAADRIASIDIQPALVSADPIGQYLSYKPLDRMFYINQLNKNAAATRRAVNNNSGGNRAAALAGILAADASYGESLGKLARQAEEYNQALKERVAGFNRQTDTFNSQQSMQAQTTNQASRNSATQMRLAQAERVAQLRQAARDAYNARRSTNLNNFINNLGNIGWEERQGDWLNNLADRGVLLMDTSGRYTGGPKAKGGKLKRKRRNTYA